MTSKPISARLYSMTVALMAIGVVIGVLLIRATRAFASLIHTEGDDLAHLVQGITRLAEILNLVFWAAVGASILLAVSFTLLLIYS